MRTLLFLSFLFGCETISQTKNIAEMAAESSRNYQEDIKKPLTQEQIDRVLKVAPELAAHQEEQKSNITVPTDASDFGRALTELGKFAEFSAFFEARGTRLTEYFVMRIKIEDARRLIKGKSTQKQMSSQIEAKIAELKAKPTDALSAEQKKQHALQIKEAEIALEKIKKMKLERPSENESVSNDAYTLSDQEIELVRQNLAAIDAVLEWDKK